MSRRLTATPCISGADSTPKGRNSLYPDLASSTGRTPISVLREIFSEKATRKQKTLAHIIRTAARYVGTTKAPENADLEILLAISVVLVPPNRGTKRRQETKTT